MMSVVAVKQLMHVAETEPYSANPKAHTEVIDRGHFRYRVVLRKSPDGAFCLTISKALLATKEQIPLKGREIERLLTPITRELAGRFEPYEPKFSLNEHSRHFRNIVT